MTRDTDDSNGRGESFDQLSPGRAFLVVVGPPGSRPMDRVSSHPLPTLRSTSNRAVQGPESLKSRREGDPDQTDPGPCLSRPVKSLNAGPKKNRSSGTRILHVKNVLTSLADAGDENSQPTSSEQTDSLILLTIKSSIFSHLHGPSF